MMVADLGLYYTKEHGRNMVAGVHSAMNTPGSAEDVQRMVTSLNFALKNNYFNIKA